MKKIGKPIKIGRLVILKSGGKAMTVTEIKDGIATCVRQYIKGCDHIARDHVYEYPVEALHKITCNK